MTEPAKKETEELKEPVLQQQPEKAKEVKQNSPAQPANQVLKKFGKFMKGK